MTARYVEGAGIDEPLAESASGLYFYNADGLGSITSLTDTTGTAVASYTYDSFGNLVVSAGTIANRLRYTGREYDSETRLYYYRARYYDPAIGHFLSEDPIRAGLNVQIYASNNPINRVDPLGLYDGWDFARDFGTFSEAFADTLTFGSASSLNNSLGAGRFVNRCSWVHKSGTAAGIAFSVVVGGAFGAEAAEANAGREGFEFSHWIPKRSFMHFRETAGINTGDGRTVFNGNYVSSKLAYLTDPYRFPPPAGAALRWGPKLHPIAQQILRVPWVYDGAIAGGTFGAVGAASGEGCGCK